MKKVVGTILSCLIILTCLSVNVCATGETTVNVSDAVELQDALTNSSNYSKVTIVLNNSINGNFSTTVENTEFIIDIGSYNLTKSSSDSPVLFINESSSSLHIKGSGSIIQQSTGNCAIICLGNLTVDNATVVNNYSDGSKPVINVGKTLTIYGGSYKGKIAFDTAVINGGTFNATAYGNISSSIVGDYIARQVTSSPDPVTYTVFHKHDSIEYINLSDYLLNKGYSLESGNYYLSNNLNIDKAIEIPEGKTVNICFNGKNLTSTSTDENKHEGIVVKGSLTVDDCNSSAGTFNFTSVLDHYYAFSVVKAEELLENGGSLTIKNINVKSNKRGIEVVGDSSLVMESGYLQSNGYTVQLYKKSEFTLNGGTIEIANETSRDSELTCIEMFDSDNGCKFYFNDGTIILGEDCCGINNYDGLIIMVGGTIKSKTKDTLVSCAICNLISDCYLYGGTISGLKTGCGAVLNLGDLCLGGNIKITGNSGPIEKYAINGYLKGQNLMLIGGKLIIPTIGDYVPNLDEMKVGIAYSEDYIEINNDIGQFTKSGSYLEGLENCFSSDYDKRKIVVGDDWLELADNPTKTNETKAEPKDETCEAVVGKDWTWDETLGVCKLKGYRIVNTATN